MLAIVTICRSLSTGSSVPFWQRIGETLGFLDVDTEQHAATITDADTGTLTHELRYIHHMATEQRYGRTVIWMQGWVVNAAGNPMVWVQWRAEP